MDSFPGPRADLNQVKAAEGAALGSVNPVSPGRSIHTRGAQDSRAPSSHRAGLTTPQDQQEKDASFSPWRLGVHKAFTQELT